MKNVRRPLRNLLAVLLIISICVCSVSASPSVGQNYSYDVLANSLGIYDPDGNLVSEFKTDISYLIKFPSAAWASGFQMTLSSEAKLGMFVYYSTAGYDSYCSTDSRNDGVHYITWCGSNIYKVTDYLYFKVVSSDNTPVSYSIRSMFLYTSQEVLKPKSYTYGSEDGAVSGTSASLPVVVNPGLQSEPDLTHEPSTIPPYSTFCDFLFPDKSQNFITGFSAVVYVTGGYKSLSLALIPKSGSKNPVIYPDFEASLPPGNYAPIISVDLSDYSLSGYSGIRLNCIANPYDIKHFPSSSKYDFRYFVQFQSGLFYSTPSPQPWYSVVAGWIKGIFDSVGGDSKIDDDPDVSNVSGSIDNIQSGAQGAIDSALPGVTSDITTISGNLAGGVSFLTSYVTGVFDGMGDIKILFLLPFFIGILLHIWGRVPNSSAVKSRLNNNKSPSDKPKGGGDKPG